VLLRQRAADPRDFGVRLLEGDPAPQPPDHAEHAVVARRLTRGRRQRHPQLRRVREPEPRRHHARDGVPLAVDAHAPADHRRVASEAPPPEPVSDQYHTLRLGALVVGEGAAQHRGDAQHGQQVPGQWHAPHPLGVATLAGERELRLAGVQAERGEAARTLAQVAVRWVGGPHRAPRAQYLAVVLAHVHQPVHVVVRHRPRPHGGHERVEGARRPDSERQRSYRHRDEDGCLEECTERETKVAAEGVHGGRGLEGE
jgi:hypothetical protein